MKNVSGILDRVDTRLNLKLIGSLPAGAIEQVSMNFIIINIRALLTYTNKTEHAVHSYAASKG